MSYEKILEFYKEIAHDKVFNNKLLEIKSETENINDPKKRIYKIINNLILPTAKEKGYEFTEKELLEYEEQIKTAASSKLSENELYSVSGGANKFIALGLTALIGASFAASGTNISSAIGAETPVARSAQIASAASKATPGAQAASASSTPSAPSTAASSALTWVDFKNFQNSDLTFAHHLEKVRFKPIGGRYDSGRLELTFDSKFSGQITISPNDIANLLLDNGIDVELAENIDIEVLSNANVTVEKNLTNTVVYMKPDRTILSVYIRSSEDRSNVFSLRKNSKSDITWLLTSSSHGEVKISQQSLNDLARGWDITDIDSIEVANKVKLVFSPDLTKAGWRPTNVSAWFGNWKYSKKPVASKSSSPLKRLFQPQIVGRMVGIKNLGNSCFLNSEFQQLYNISHFREGILSLPNVDPHTQPTTLGLQILFRGMRDASNGDRASIDGLYELSEIAINVMNSSSKGKIFDEHQEDSHEAFLKILDRCFEESPILRPIISTEFNIEGKSVITNKGKVHSSTRVVDNGLALPINKDVQIQTLDSVLSEYFQPENIDDFRLSPKKTGTVQKAYQATHPPRTLQLQLKRFSHRISPTGEFEQFKLNNRVEFPENLHLDAAHWGEDCQYNLTGIVIHSGSAGGGHYYSYVKDPHSGDWYKLNDSQITRVGNFGNIREECFGNGRSSTSAYGLFYSRA